MVRIWFVWLVFMISCHSGMLLTHFSCFILSGVSSFLAFFIFKISNLFLNKGKEVRGKRFFIENYPFFNSFTFYWSNLEQKTVLETLSKVILKPFCTRIPWWSPRKNLWSIFWKSFLLLKNPDYTPACWIFMVTYFVIRIYFRI